ncbi:hypothetical protein BGLA2_1250004 [Burkholderia gladioli]|nr:hypothetical protein BGLA2_1250004 [Burkholderia gladioli]
MNHDRGEFRAHVLRALGDRDRHLPRDLAIARRHRGIGRGGHGRRAAVGLLADRDVQRQAAKHRHAVVGRHARGAPRAEHVFLVPAVRADVDAHVLDDAEDRDAHLLEHLEALLGVEQGDVLRRGDDHRAGHRHALRQRELDVAGARRHVDDQVVQVLPVGLSQQLFQRRGRHRPAPDHRIVLVDQEADRVGLQAVAHQRVHGLVVGRVGAAVHAEHGRQRGAVDVGVEDAHRGAFLRQRQRQVDGGGALAHAALARGHRHDVLHVRQQLHAALHGVGDDVLADRHARGAHARHLGQHGGHALAHVLVLAERRVTEHHADGNRVAVDRDLANALVGGVGAAGVGVDERRERGVDSGPFNTHRNSVDTTSPACHGIASEPRILPAKRHQSSDYGAAGGKSERIYCTTLRETGRGAMIAGGAGRGHIGPAAPIL